MGLDISGSVTKKTYHASYSGLHQIRYLALITVGFPDGEARTLFPRCYVIPAGLTAEDLNKAMIAMQVVGCCYPNLMLHSDCEGGYTKNGRVMSSADWFTGNSVQLLDELKDLRESLNDRYKTGYAWELFQRFYDLVEDEVKNGRGTVRFH